MREGAKRHRAHCQAARGRLDVKPEPRVRRPLHDFGGQTAFAYPGGARQKQTCQPRILGIE